MNKVQTVRLQMSKTKDMMMTIGVDEKRHMDIDHDMYFLRIYLNLRKMLDHTNDINVVQLDKMANRYLAFFRNDNKDMTIKSINKILQWCHDNGVNEVAFDEDEINKLNLNEVQDIANNYDVNIFILI